LRKLPRCGIRARIAVSLYFRISKVRREVMLFLFKFSVQEPSGLYGHESMLVIGTMIDLEGTSPLSYASRPRL
jgi:hypothetical protein